MPKKVIILALSIPDDSPLGKLDADQLHAEAFDGYFHISLYNQQTREYDHFSFDKTNGLEPFVYEIHE